MANMARSNHQMNLLEASEVMQIFHVLCYGYHKGTLTLDDFRSSLQELMVLDSTGRTWTIGATSGKWYRKAGGRWVEDEPQGPLRFPQLRTGVWPQDLEQHAAAALQRTVKLDRRTRRSLELKEDRLAEEERRRRGLTVDQELDEIREARPAFMEEYDKREYQKLLRLSRESQGQVNGVSIRHSPQQEERTNPPPKQPWIYDIDRFLNELTPAQLHLYSEWKKKIDCFLRRYPEKWST